MTWKRIVLLIVAALAVLFGVAVWKIGGPSMLLGMLRYDERREGSFRVGDRAPDVSLVKLDGTGWTSLAGSFGRRPVVLVFGSYT